MNAVRVGKLVANRLLALAGALLLIALVLRVWDSVSMSEGGTRAKARDYRVEPKDGGNR